MRSISLRLSGIRSILLVSRPSLAIDLVALAMTLMTLTTLRIAMRSIERWILSRRLLPS
uniref:Uncharacterized protein n=1 Tax=Picea glauca TaxID=3330 RepID=A0A117NFR7_PICGL|nr:hypothetical protein ABT39_MTgene2454 [Picea glauca]QHR88523.1 hypothetical protein Q903MT_gene2537 [Picea sitchensis]